MFPQVLPPHVFPPGASPSCVSPSCFPYILTPQVLLLCYPGPRELSCVKLANQILLYQLNWTYAGSVREGWCVPMNLTCTYRSTGFACFTSRYGIVLLYKSQVEALFKRATGTEYSVLWWNGLVEGHCRLPLHCQPEDS